MAFIKGDEREIVSIPAIDENVSVTEGNFNTALFMSLEKDIAKQIVTKFADITGLEDGSVLENKLKAFFASGNKKVVIFGKDIKASSGTPPTLEDSLKELDLDEFFYVLTDEIDPAKIKTDAATILAFGKQYVATPDITKTSAEIQTALAGETGDYTIIASLNDQSADARIVGYASPLVIGNYAFTNNVVEGGVDGGFKGTDFSAFETNNIGFMARVKGNIITQNIVTMGGKDLDYSVALKYMEDRIESDLTQMLIAASKFSFSEDRAKIISTVKTRMANFAKNGVVVAADTLVTLMPLEDTVKNDKIKGIIKGLEIEFVYDNGVKRVEGTLFSK